MDSSELATAPVGAVPAIDGADTAWLIMACALVLLMTPALAFFYGGLVRSKNALNTMMVSAGVHQYPAGARAAESVA